MLNSHVTFSSLMTIVLGGLKDSSDAYIDDITISVLYYMGQIWEQ